MKLLHLKLLLEQSLQAARQLRQHFSNFLLRHSCLLCNEATQTTLTLCVQCLAQLPWLSQTCSRCALPLEGVILLTECGQCLQQQPPFQRTIALFEYKPPIDKLINDFKFHARLTSGHVLGKLLAKKIRVSYSGQALPELIIPIPLHTSRLRQRGYNQAVELARPIAHALQIPINRYDCQRTKSTLPQSKISALERRKNLRNAFYCPPLTAQHVAIIDDVVTTTSTVREFAKMLQKAGVKKIDVWCIARTI
jgi:ComF family protein